MTEMDDDEQPVLTMLTGGLGCMIAGVLLVTLVIVVWAVTGSVPLVGMLGGP